MISCDVLWARAILHGSPEAPTDHAIHWNGHKDALWHKNAIGTLQLTRWQPQNLLLPGGMHVLTPSQAYVFRQKFSPELRCSNDDIDFVDLSSYMPAPVVPGDVADPSVPKKYRSLYKLLGKLDQPWPLRDHKPEPLPRKQPAPMPHTLHTPDQSSVDCPCKEHDLSAPTPDSWAGKMARKGAASPDHWATKALRVYFTREDLENGRNSIQDDMKSWPEANGRLSISVINAPLFRLFITGTGLTQTAVILPIRIIPIPIRVTMTTITTTMTNDVLLMPSIVKTGLTEPIVGLLPCISKATITEATITSNVLVDTLINTAWSTLLRLAIAFSSTKVWTLKYKPQ
ncbi:hypothetical protein F4859DRAFT_519620 [Xylaria cf. heliscus]|nr:hypothetical protein F4859DRAFT_519620 [Xylaria cf. heliscus]